MHSSPRPSSRTAALRAAVRCAAAALALSAAPAAAQQSGPPALTLEQVVATTLERSRSIAIAAQRLDASRGERLAASGAFDPRFSAEATSETEDARQLGSDGTISAASSESRATSYTLGLAQQLRAGLTLTPSLTLGRSTAPVSAAPSYTRASVDVELRLPLMRDRLGSVTRVAERAATRRVRAEELHLRQSTGDAVLEAAAAYWSYAAAQERLDVYRLALERAERLTDETRQLVQAQERPAADLNQLLANAASRRMARIRAEQEVAEARRRLGLAMGLGAADLARLPRAAGDFPDPAPFHAGPEAADRLRALALERRPDLGAVGAQAQAAALLAEGAHSARRPRLDLSVRVGYRGAESGDAAEHWLGPLYRDVPGASVGVKLSYEGALRNSQAQGRAAQADAALRQQHLAATDLREQIASGVDVALQSLERSLLALAEAEQAVELYRTTVENERRKHELGAATLIDVILAENNLTNAQLATVDARLSHALSLAELRFHTGTLPGQDGDAAPGGASVLLTPP